MRYKQYKLSFFFDIILIVTLLKGIPNQHNYKIPSDSAVDFQKNTTASTTTTRAIPTTTKNGLDLHFLKLFFKSASLFKLK